VSDAKAHYRKGYDYAERGMWDEAIGEYTNAITINPKYALAYFMRGGAYYHGG
jgi:tetratricopeptide (TPR) repeat protein